jgi:hypothetical protein
MACSTVQAAQATAISMLNLCIGVTLRATARQALLPFVQFPSLPPSAWPQLHAATQANPCTGKVRAVYANPHDELVRLSTPRTAIRSP